MAKRGLDEGKKTSETSSPRFLSYEDENHSGMLDKLHAPRRRKKGSGNDEDGTASTGNWKYCIMLRRPFFQSLDYFRNARGTAARKNMRLARYLHDHAARIYVYLRNAKLNSGLVSRGRTLFTSHAERSLTYLAS